MLVRVELKAWLDDHESIMAQLSLLESRASAREKTDTYWLPIEENAPGMSIPRSGVRVRREREAQSAGGDKPGEAGSEGAKGESFLVAVKSRKMSGAAEISEVSEFAVSDAELFEKLLGNLGLFKASYKKKYCWGWKIPAEAPGAEPIGAEIAHLKELGWFLELKLCARDGGRQAAEEAVKRLHSLLERLGVPAERLEPKPYAVLLHERWQKEVRAR